MWTKLPVEDFFGLQDELLRGWLQNEVIAHSAYWNMRLSDLSIDSAETLEDIPAASEKDLVNQGGAGNPALMIMPKYKTGVSEDRPSGLKRLFTKSRRVEEIDDETLLDTYKPIHVHETGLNHPLAIAWSNADLRRGLLAGERLGHVLGLESDDAIINLVPAGPTLAFWGMVHLGRGMGMAALHPRGAGEGVVSPARRALSLMPASVIAVPTEDAGNLVNMLLDEGIKRPTIRTFLCVGPPPESGLRSQIVTMAEKICGRRVQVQSVWGPSAGRVLYGEAPMPIESDPEEYHGLITYGDMDIVSVRNVGNGLPAQPYEPGELVLSTLGWLGTALVRYATGSYVGGITSGEPHPILGIETPRIVGSVKEGFWQPLVNASPFGMREENAELIRPDFRGLQGPISRIMESAGAQEWALVVRYKKLFLYADKISRPMLETALSNIRELCGIEPQFEIGLTDAIRRQAILGEYEYEFIQ